MQRSTFISAVLMGLGALYLILRVTISEQGMGKAYVRVVPQAVDAQHPDGRWQTVEPADPAEYWRAETADPGQTAVRWSGANSVGIWVAAFFTLAIFSFLYRDNPAYKVAEAVVVGVSAAYWITLPVNVTGAMKPDRGMEMNSTGMPQLPQSSTFWLVTSLHLRGEVGQQEKTVRGRAFSSSALPRTASWRSFMIPKASTVKAPVTTGFSPYRRLRYSR